MQPCALPNAMKKLLLLSGLVLLSFCAGCGIINSGNGGGGGGGNLGGNFSKASLNGNYTFQVSGDRPEHLPVVS